MSVTLRKRKNGDGTTSLLLDVYNHGRRSYEFLKHLKLSASTSPLDRQGNKEKLEQAKKIAIKRAQELSANDYDMTTETGKKALVVDWMQGYINNYKKKDIKNLKGALGRFKDFLLQEKIKDLTFARLNESIVEGYRDYLKEHNKGEGAASYFQRFKKMLKAAHRKKIITSNPAEHVLTPKGEAKQKEVLTLDEIKLLVNTETESIQVKNAFIFCCMTGLRWIEVNNLKWKNINVNQKYMSVVQTKTGKEKKIPLNDAAIKLIAKPANEKVFVFDLPSSNGANKTLKAWVKRAGINKKDTTWHVARHTFGTNLAYHETDLFTIMRLLGHTTTKHTQRYVRTADELKQRATDKLNIDINI